MTNNDVINEFFNDVRRFKQNMAAIDAEHKAALAEIELERQRALREIDERLERDLRNTTATIISTVIAATVVSATLIGMMLTTEE